MNSSGPGGGSSGHFSSGSPNITVAVRVRPLNASEGNQRSVLRVVDDRVLVFDTKDALAQQHGHNAARRAHGHNGNANKTATFAFDKVFDELSSSQRVFEDTARPLLDELLRGYNCCCFAYGATGAGKTFTMIGSEENPGVMVLTVRELFARLEALKETHACALSLSYLEIYNEHVRDILVDGAATLALREENGNVSVAGISQHSPTSAAEVFDLLARGNARRTLADTAANAQSSRSHAVCTVRVTLRPRHASSGDLECSAKLQLIDLAGSERAANTKNQGVRLREGANINRSLLALANCITTLSSGKATQHVPFRNSKLTRLLKDSLGGNCKTVMIANVTPGFLAREDTHNTLQYAARATHIRNNAQRNARQVRPALADYAASVAELRRELASFREDARRAAELQQRISEPRARADQAALRLAQLEAQALTASDADIDAAVAELERIEAATHREDAVASAHVAILQRDVTRMLLKAERLRNAALHRAIEWEKTQNSLMQTYNLVDVSNLPSAVPSVSVAEKIDTDTGEQMPVQRIPQPTPIKNRKPLRLSEVHRDPGASAPPTPLIAHSEKERRKVQFRSSPQAPSAVPQTPADKPLKSILLPTPSLSHTVTMVPAAASTAASTTRNTMINQTPLRTPGGNGRFRGPIELGPAKRVITTPLKDVGNGGSARRSTITGAEAQRMQAERRLSSAARVQPHHPHHHHTPKKSNKPAEWQAKPAQLQ